MGQATLVNEFIEDGRKLVRQLTSQNVDVQAFAWIRTSDDVTGDSRWSLYVVSKWVDDHGQAAAYRQVHAAFQKLGRSRIFLGVRMLGLSSSIAKDLMDFMQRAAGDSPIHFQGARLGELSVDEAFI